MGEKSAGVFGIEMNYWGLAGSQFAPGAVLNVRILIFFLSCSWDYHHVLVFWRVSLMSRGEACFHALGKVRRPVIKLLNHRGERKEVLGV